jgi:hypothetical protein
LIEATICNLKPAICNLKSPAGPCHPTPGPYTDTVDITLAHLVPLTFPRRGPLIIVRGDDTSTIPARETRIMIGRCACSALMLLALWAAAAGAQTQPPPTCTSSEHRQFDFWIGVWDVYNPQGQQIGVNRIDSVLSGCVLEEHWESLRSANRGTSYNIYDRRTGRWHQSWVDNGGSLLLLNGALHDGRMVLSGATAGRDGAETLNRITWTPVATDSVRQLWETSSDGGGTWSVAFDGMYVKRD